MNPDQNPILLFRQWYLEAVDSGIHDPTIMTLATTGNDFRPSARIVLLKDFDERGFVFYSNYRSHKGEQIASSPWAALVIHWEKLGYQVRIEGRISKTSVEESDKYFASRPRGSQLGAWASMQSQVISSRESLESRMQKMEEKFKGRDVPRPAYWGGYRLRPDRMEFWIHQENRMHDRIVFEKIIGLEKSGYTDDRDEDVWVGRWLAP
jgi:pyridoxamine 5'-phosphate oxidase